MTDTADAAWTELCERDDRTSPEEYPDMCLITRDELADFMGLAAQPRYDQAAMDKFYGAGWSAMCAEAAAWVKPDHLRRLKDPSDPLDSVHVWAEPPATGFQPLYATPAQPDTGEIERLKTGIAEAYQVIASVADAGGLWHHDAVQKALTYFADDSMEGEILPFSIDRPDTGDVAALREAKGIIDNYFMDDDYDANGALRKVSAIIDAALSKPNAPGAHEDGGA